MLVYDAAIAESGEVQFKLRLCEHEEPDEEMMEEASIAALTLLYGKEIKPEGFFRRLWRKFPWQLTRK